MAGTFYDDWLATEAEIQAELRASPGVAKDRDIPWVSTRQDAKVKLMIANELGYSTMGSNVLKAEIPVGWHTGMHRHGEEGLHILQGEGFTIVEGQRFDWHAGSTLQIPYRAAHQHVNTGSVPAVYLSGMTFSLERFVRLASLQQLEDCGPNDPTRIAATPSQASQYYPDGARAVIHIEDAPWDPGLSAEMKLAANVQQHDKIQFLSVPENGFRGTSVAVTHLWEEPPYHRSGRHKHLEAVVYAVAGEGYTELEGTKVHWEAGDVLYVPPAMWEHAHYNDNPNPIRQLRIQFGIRYWYTGIWPQYTSQRIYDERGEPIVAGPIERIRERS